MKKQFVTYEIAKKLKELGCQEPSMCYFSITNSQTLQFGEKYAFDYSKFVITAIMWQQAIDWILLKGFVVMYNTDKTILEKDILKILNYIFELERTGQYL